MNGKVDKPRQFRFRPGLLAESVFLGGVVGLLAAYFKHDEALVEKPGCKALLHIGLVLCIAIGIACFVLSFEARECPNCDIIVKSNYCEVCGYQARTEKYPVELYCFECGADIDTETNFCPHCGVEV